MRRRHEGTTRPSAGTTRPDPPRAARKTGAGRASQDHAITQATLAQLRAECPGWDYDVLHAEFRAWVEDDPARIPANYQLAFIGFVRRHHARNRHIVAG
jgi:hypothetical protein